MKTDLVWKTVKKKVSELMPWEGNPRRMTEKQAADLMESIERLNLMSIPVVDLDLRLVSGHQRMKILALLGRQNEVIDVRIPNRKLTEEEYREANIRENKNLGEWDEDLLANFDRDFLLDTGFSEDDLNTLFDLTVREASGVDPDDVPPEPEVVYVEFGQTYDLDGHILVCGDSTDKALMDKLVETFPPALLFTDPPYGVSAAGGRSQTVKKKQIREIANDELRGDSLFRFYVSFLKPFVRPGVSVYMCYGHESQCEAIQAIRASGLKHKSTIIWDKTVFGLSGHKGYRPQHELIVSAEIEPGEASMVAFATEGKGYTWTGRKNQADVWRIPRSKDRPGNHPTPKPVAVPLRAILNSSLRGQVVHDPFIGVGATLIACEMTGRKCIGVDLDPSYIQTSIERWEKFTGKKAVKK